jgi:APA family basic amino acid/polyamine antiporter
MTRRRTKQFSEDRTGALAAPLRVIRCGLPVFFASLLILRKSEPDLPRPYKAWWYPWSTVLVLLASVAFLLGSVIGDLKHSLFTAILILLSYVASILIVREKGHQGA